MGVISVSASYVILYVNEEYFGFYVLMVAPKLSWIEQVFGEKDTKNLYKCKSGGQQLTEQTSAYSCENENDDATDRTEWIDFLKALDNAKTIEEIGEVLDIEQFTYIAVYDYLLGGYDNFFYANHNYSMYKNKDTGKWIIIYYDFDANFGLDIMSHQFGELNPNPNKDFPHYTLREWFRYNFNLIEVGIFGNLPLFESKLVEVIKNDFNPAVLFPHIDELKKFIKPYVLHDKTPDENGHKPGILNLKSPEDYSMEHWDANSEFTTINVQEIGTDAYGIKYWILEKYRDVCTRFNLECDPVYMDHILNTQLMRKLKVKLIHIDGMVLIG